MFGADDEPDGVPADGGAGFSISPPDELADPSGEWLVRRVAAGDAVAEDRFVRLFQQAILATAAVRLRDLDDAREVADDVLMAVITALRAGRIRDPERLPAFVRATTRNLINNRYRQRRRRPRSTAPVEDLAGPEPEAELERADRDRIVRRMLAELAPLDSRILELSLFSGLDAVEIASQLGLAPACVRQRKHRAIQRITARLARIG